MLFLNQVWNLNVPQGSDLPYWSLGYEVWYYAIFGLATFAPRRWRTAGVLAALAFAGPAIAAMLPLWLSGLFGYRLCALRPIRRPVGWMLFAGSLAAWGAYQLWGQDHLAAMVNVPAFLKRPGLPDDYVVGTLFIVHIIGFHAISPAFEGISIRLQKPVRWAAGATFSIYLFHLPVAQFLATQVPWPPTSSSTRLVLFGGTLLILFALAELSERRKDLWRRAFKALFARVQASPELAT